MSETIKQMRGLLELRQRELDKLINELKLERYTLIKIDDLGKFKFKFNEK
jgi:hypothetical protein